MTTPKNSNSKEFKEVKHSKQTLNEKPHSPLLPELKTVSVKVISDDCLFSPK